MQEALRGVDLGKGKITGGFKVIGERGKRETRKN